jgi:hypothetical protein
MMALQKKHVVDDFLKNFSKQNKVLRVLHLRLRISDIHQQVLCDRMLQYITNNLHYSNLGFSFQATGPVICSNSKRIVHPFTAAM